MSGGALADSDMRNRLAKYPRDKVKIVVANKKEDAKLQEIDDNTNWALVDSDNYEAYARKKATVQEEYNNLYVDHTW